MTKRPRATTKTQPCKKHKKPTSHKRHLTLADNDRECKRAKVYEYWHLAPLTRAERAAHMAAIYERLCCKA